MVGMLGIQFPEYLKDLLGQWLTFQLFGITYALWLTKKMLFFLAAANSQFFWKF